jgi:preprotein translocase subunit SecD
MPPGVDLLWAATPTKGSGTVDRALYAVQDGPILTGESVIDAQARDDDGVTLLFELSRRGGETFEAATARHLNDYLAFVLDGRVLTEPARIRGTIRQRGSVELGSVTLEDAKDVALILRTGALPAPINVLEMRSDTLP